MTAGGGAGATGGDEPAAAHGEHHGRGGREPVSRARLWRGVAVVVPLGALAYALLFTAPGADEVTDALGALRPRIVALALAGETVHLLALAQAYRAGLAAVGARLPYRRQLASYVAGMGVGQLLPAGGALGGAVVGHRMISFGAPRAATAAAVALTGTLSLLSVALLVGVGLAVVGITGDHASTVLTAVAVAVVLLVAAVALLVAVTRSSERGRRLLDLVERPMRRVGADTRAWRTSLDRLAEAPPTARGLTAVVGWALLAWTGNAAALWAAFAGLGEPLPLDVLLVGFGVQHLVAMIPVSPGGVGVVEAGVAGTVTALGVAGGTAVSGVVVYRLVVFWLPVVLGLAVHLRLVAGDAPS